MEKRQKFLKDYYNQRKILLTIVMAKRVHHYGEKLIIELAPFYYEYGNALLTKVFVHSCDVIPID